MTDESEVLDVLTEVQLERFFVKIRDHLQITQLVTSRLCIPPRVIVVHYLPGITGYIRSRSREARNKVMTLYEFEEFVTLLVSHT